ncbi:PIN domain-containing protein [bacterium]|nr:MAG: PIN domain-containing protein [bacterium]
MLRILLDTNIALRLYDIEGPFHLQVESYIKRRGGGADTFLIAPQVLFELRVVMTRPIHSNGYGQSAADFTLASQRLMRFTEFNPDPPDLLERWLNICARHEILGKQSHDARLVAWMEAYNVEAILTLNPRHFAAFTGIQVLTP